MEQKNTKNPRWKAGLILALIFIIGYTAGIGTFLSLFYFKARAFSYRGTPTRIIKVMTRALSLNQEQKSSIENILRHTRDDLLHLRDDTKPKIKNRLDLALKEIRLLLNEDQIILFDRYVKKRRARYKKMQDRILKWRNSE